MLWWVHLRVLHTVVMHHGSVRHKVVVVHVVPHHVTTVWEGIAEVEVRLLRYMLVRCRRWLRSGGCAHEVWRGFVHEPSELGHVGAVQLVLGLLEGHFEVVARHVLSGMRHEEVVDVVLLVRVE
jgi:hypothetical protein